MSIDLETAPATSDSYEQYRTLSTSSVASLILGVLSVTAILDWWLVTIPVIGVALSVYALLNVRRHAAELAGAGLARVGLVLSLAFAVIGPALLTYLYISEKPDGYERVSYSELQPDPAQAGQVVPESATALEGKKIFIKGFIYPGRDKDGIRQFLLVRDQGDCCFGGNPKITDRIQVTLAEPLRLSYTPRIHHVGGVFRVAPANQAVGGAKGGVLYHLQADYLH